MKLHLGVTDISYATPPSKGRKRAKKGAGTQTTGQVAEWLEDEYHIMEHFFELHQGEIAKSFEEAAAGALETAMMQETAPERLNLDSATSEIEAMFKKMLAEKELDNLGYPGIPTQAALRGVSHRMLHPYARRAPRPSFLDTGLYSASFKSWID